jgi:hypothetical protein
MNSRRERKMFDKLKAMKQKENGICYVCKDELSGVDYSDGITQTQAAFGNDNKEHKFLMNATILNEGGKEVTACKGCFVKALVGLAQSLIETHAVDPRDMN